VPKSDLKDAVLREIEKVGASRLRKVEATKEGVCSS
jgi:hypothetical protein